MKNKSLFIGLAVISFVLAGVVIWYGSMSVAKRMDMVTMRARFEAAQKAESSGRRQAAATAYQLALMEYQKGLAKPGYYLDIAGDFLTAGNCFQKLGQLRAALAAYEKGLQKDPHSISLLTSAGLCSLQLGELELAGTFLAHSRKIYPHDKRVNRALKKLKLQSPGKRGQ
jgi:tetratricopeptide (TPR) repeat protein